jgi:hypothetical protein
VDIVGADLPESYSRVEAPVVEHASGCLVLATTIKQAARIGRPTQQASVSYWRIEQWQTYGVNTFLEFLGCELYNSSLTASPHRYLKVRDKSQIRA